MEDDPFGALDQESRAYVFFHDVMMKRYFDKEYQKSAEMAEELLMIAQVPDLIRARCHMVLSQSVKNAFSVEHAQTAITLIDVEVRKLVTTTYPFPQDQLDEAQRCLQSAEQAARRRARKREARQKSTAIPDAAGDTTDAPAAETANLAIREATRPVSGTMWQQGQGIPTPMASDMPSSQPSIPSDPAYPSSEYQSFPAPREDRQSVGEGEQQHEEGEQRGGERMEGLEGQEQHEKGEESRDEESD